MLALERHKIILDYLENNQIATTQFLSDLTHASLATVRRDLNELDQQGLLTKTHGGAQRISREVLNASAHAAANAGVCTFKYPDPYYDFKDAIAKRSAEFISPNDIIFVGAGLTCNLLCRYINENTRENITIVTTNITAVMEFANNPQANLLLLGGNVHMGTNHIETLDEYTVQSLKKLYFDKVFITVDGIDLNYGYSIINRAQLPLYNHLISNSKQIYLLANDGKYDKRTFTQWCSLDRIPNVITNSTVNQQYLNYYQQHNIHVYTV